MNKELIIKKLSLTKHIEGGYFGETYRSEGLIETDRENSSRSILTSIYYMLTDDRNIGYFHVNKSDIIHYFHGGSALTYLIIHPNGKLEKIKLGNDLLNGQVPQLIVRGGCYKATILEDGEYGLLGEAVAPGFDYIDMKIAKAEELSVKFPELMDEISEYIKK
ncbi:MAG: cupin domain-containing protein [Deltaproteobacteria bacterium]|nr:cupin domain-containing protein [Deltaproteobacteria bacterium]